MDNLEVCPKRVATISDLADWLAAVDRGEWTWTRNSRCKYVVLHIDTRSGAYRIDDRDGNEIDLAALTHGTRTPTMAGDYVMVPRDFVEFLCGSQPWDNVWFGDQNPVGRGNFWWRKALRGFAASPTGGE